MPDQSPPGSTIAFRNHPWNLTVRLRHTPICPNCAEPLTPLGVTFVLELAFCTPCGRGPLATTLKLAQLLRAEPFAPHLTNAHGLTYYTPTTYEPLTAFKLAERMNMDWLLAQLPIDPLFRKIPLDSLPPPPPPDPHSSSAPPASQDPQAQQPEI